MASRAELDQERALSPAATETDYEVGQDNVRILGLDVHNPVFVSAVVIVGFVIFALMFQAGFGAFFGWLRPWLTSTFETGCSWVRPTSSSCSASSSW